MYGQIAQSVEQRIENPCVGGSIPPLATIYKKPHFAVFFCLYISQNILLYLHRIFNLKLFIIVIFNLLISKLSFMYVNDIYIESLQMDI